MLEKSYPVRHGVTTVNFGAMWGAQENSLQRKEPMWKGQTMSPAGRLYKKENMEPRSTRVKRKASPVR